MAANYTLAYVQPDGNPHDEQAFGADLAAALRGLALRRELSEGRTIHWMVYDADDPERGYFDEGGDFG